MKEIIEEAEALAVEERLIIIDSLLRTLNPPTLGIDSQWTEVAERRLKEQRLGSAKKGAWGRSLWTDPKALQEMKLSFHPESMVEFFEVVDFYEHSELDRGHDFSIEIRATIRNILGYPNAWP